jgi:phage-related protein
MIIELPSAKKLAVFMASSKRDLRNLPDPVNRILTFAILLAERGKMHPDAKPMKGFGGAGVLEVVDNYDGDTYRAVYTVKFEGVVYVLDVFQKKSKRGRATPQVDLDRIKSRLVLARQHYEANYRQRATVGIRS